MPEINRCNSCCSRSPCRRELRRNITESDEGSASGSRSGTTSPAKGKRESCEEPPVHWLFWGRNLSKPPRASLERASPIGSSPTIEWKRPSTCRASTASPLMAMWPQTPCLPIPHISLIQGSLTSLGCRRGAGPKDTPAYMTAYTTQRALLRWSSYLIPIL